jgi:hypothetical protein
MDIPTGAPLTMAEIDERLTEVGIYEQPGDREANREEVSPPSDWTWAENTCSYVAAMISNWATDGPKLGGGRNPWTFSQHIRLSCAHRLSCITEADHRRALKILADQFTHLVRTTEPRREPKKFEIADMIKYGIKRAASKTDEEALAELGGHTHVHPNVEWTTRISGAHHDDQSADHREVSTVVETSHSGQLRIAYRLAESFADRLLFVHGIGWHYYDTKRWAPDDIGAAKRALIDVLRTPLADSLGDKELRADVRRCESAAGLGGVLEIASALKPFAATVRDLDADPYLLNVANGTLDLRTMELSPHDPADRLTKVTRGAHTPETKPGDWHQFITTVLPDEQVRVYVQRHAGVSLLGKVIEHILSIWTGSGANGKGTAIGALCWAVGDYAITAEPDLFMHREGAHPTGEMDLMGRRLVVVTETDEGRRLAEATMKRLTGGDHIRARRMRQDFIEFEPSHTPILVTNHLPAVSGDDPAV